MRGFNVFFWTGVPLVTAVLFAGGCGHEPEYKLLNQANFNSAYGREAPDGHRDFNRIDANWYSYTYKEQTILVHCYKAASTGDIHFDSVSLEYSPCSGAFASDEVSPCDPEPVPPPPAPTVAHPQSRLIEDRIVYPEPPIVRRWRNGPPPPDLDDIEAEISGLHTQIRQILETLHANGLGDKLPPLPPAELDEDEDIPSAAAPKVYDKELANLLMEVEKTRNMVAGVSGGIDRIETRQRKLNPD